MKAALIALLLLCPAVPAAGEAAREASLSFFINSLRNVDSVDESFDADYYLILAGDHLYRMNYGTLIEAHKKQGADITIAAQPVDAETAD